MSSCPDAVPEMPENTELRKGERYPASRPSAITLPLICPVPGYRSPIASSVLTPSMSFRHTTLNFCASSSHTLATLNLPTGLPANSVESQRRLRSMPALSDDGDMSIALPVVRPLMP